MGSIYYDGIPIESLDVDKVYQEELQTLKDYIEKIESCPPTRRMYWAIKMQRANKDLEVGKVTLDGC